MKKHLICLVLTSIAVLFVSCQKAPELSYSQNSSPKSKSSKEERSKISLASDSSEYIVFYKDSYEKLPIVRDRVANSRDIVTRTEASVRAFLQGKGIRSERIGNIYSYFRGFTAKLSKEELATLSLDPNIKNIVANKGIKIDLPKPTSDILKEGATSSSESLPVNIDRTWTIWKGGSTTSNVCWVLDTGCDLDHYELNVDQQRAISFVSNEPSAEDYNGHGTHVAGIIGARQNGSGIIGVAPGARIVPVKVLNAQGVSDFATLLKGLDYVALNASSGDVVNISIETPKNPDVTLDNVIIALSTPTRFIYTTISAGNFGDNTIFYPMARISGHYNIEVVAAVDNNDNFANDFSNYGSNVVASYGVKIYSTWLNGGFATLTGTSQAAPHVAGIHLYKPISCGCPCPSFGGGWGKLRKEPQKDDLSPKAMKCYVYPFLKKASNYNHEGTVPDVMCVQNWQYLGI